MYYSNEPSHENSSAMVLAQIRTESNWMGSTVCAKQHYDGRFYCNEALPCIRSSLTLIATTCVERRADVLRSPCIFWARVLRECSTVKNMCGINKSTSFQMARILIGTRSKELTEPIHTHAAKPVILTTRYKRCLRYAISGSTVDLSCCSCSRLVAADG